MKKFLMVLGVAGLLFVGSGAQAVDGERVVEKVVLYPVNLVMDALDTFTLNLGFGPVLCARLQATSAVWGGGRVGMSWMMYKAYNRQYGFGTEDGWYWEFVVVGEENFGVLESTSLVNKFTEVRTGFPEPFNPVYRNGCRDYWAIGGSLGGLVIGDLYVHPVDIADFFTGLVFYDLKGDDLIFDDFR